jgi:hypothetical protein
MVKLLLIQRTNGIFYEFFGICYELSHNIQITKLTNSRCATDMKNIQMAGEDIIVYNKNLVVPTELTQVLRDYAKEVC